MKLDDLLFERLLHEAENSPRKRSHQNIHESFDDPVQRLCIALIKGTYVRPHYHSQLNKWEMMLALRGIVGVLLFDHVGKVEKRFELSPNKALSGLDILPGNWHAIFPLTDKAILLEIKEGPYCPLEPEDFATWAPTENGRAVGKFLSWAESALVGDVFSKVATDIE
ncbi:MAG: WbuC family cupin fold metalloprotein [Candidatus Berkelbacteria bacterium]|nr:WbuC family cupin fold metalloprotein [Candidatus Berkelbacteria bacterium]